MDGWVEGSWMSAWLRCFGCLAVVQYELSIFGEEFEAKGEFLYDAIREQD